MAGGGAAAAVSTLAPEKYAAIWLRRFTRSSSATLVPTASTGVQHHHVGVLPDE